MIDPRFANAGAAPFVPGFGAQQVPTNYHHHRHHRHHKHKGQNNASPLSRDESIHKVDHGQHHHHHHQHNEQAAFGGGYGVPYGTGAQFGYGNQQQGGQFGQGPAGGGHAGPAVKHHRRHHRHHRHHATEAVVGSAGVVGGDQAHAVPEQLIGQRSSSVLSQEAHQVRSPVPHGGDEQVIHHRRHHHHHHHHGGEHAGAGHTHQSRRAQHGHGSVGADGYGHINDDLIFIERGDHSPHRQEPPPGYDYQGKIEVQGYDKEQRSQSRGTGSFIPPPPAPIAPPQSAGPCPPGWQQMILTAGGVPCPCPPGGAMFTGQLGGGGGGGGFSGGAGFSGAGPAGGAGYGGGLANLAASFPLPPQGQIVADYIIESAAGGINSSGGSGFATGHQPGCTAGFSEQFHQQETEQHVTARPKIFEVWQRRKKTETQGKSRSRSRSKSPGPGFDFDKFRNDILGAIERIVQGSGGKAQWTGPGQSGGTQTEIRQVIQKEAGEVRVIVQPIQPVFYMPQQSAAGGTSQVGPGAPAPQSSAPHIVYVPRNVYIPVIKPVFVPRERVIIRPQVIHVARPVLVDRPVPVTQRPIIIDRERPIPVPVRGPERAAAAQGGGSRVVREEHVYRDNLPVAYGGRCAEFAGGVNYGYMPAQQEHQYAASSSHEAVNVNVPNQFEHSRSASHLIQQGVGGFQESYSNLARANSASAVNVGQVNQHVIQQTFEQSAHAAGVPANCQTQIEILDTAVNPHWQKTDKSSLMRRYGRPAYEIVQRTDQVEQQMYNELRQRSSSGGAQRSVSSASFGSGSGIGANGGGGIPHY